MTTPSDSKFGSDQHTAERYDVAEAIFGGLAALRTLESSLLNGTEENEVLQVVADIPLLPNDRKTEIDYVNLFRGSNRAVLRAKILAANSVNSAAARYREKPGKYVSYFEKLESEIKNFGHDVAAAVSDDHGLAEVLPTRLRQLMGPEKSPFRRALTTFDNQIPVPGSEGNLTRMLEAVASGKAGEFASAEDFDDALESVLRLSDIIKNNAASRAYFWQNKTVEVERSIKSIAQSSRANDPTTRGHADAVDQISR